MPTSARKLLAFDPTYGVPTEVNTGDIGSIGQVILSGVGGVAVDAQGNLLSNVADPVSPTDAANKRYVDNIAVGIDAIDSCRALSASNIASLSGTVTVDGVSLVAQDRVLLIGQTNAVTNGVWVVQSGAWKRPSDFGTGIPAAGKHTFIEGGTTYAKNGFVCNSTKGQDTVDTSPLYWTQFSGLGEVTAGNGLIKSGDNGNTVAVNLATNPGLQFTANALDLFLQPAGSLTKDATGVGIKVNANNTLATDANGLRTLGLPTLFTVAGVATDANVTAPNLNTLVDGNSSYADSLHSHKSVLSAQAVSAIHKNGITALNPGDPVQWSTTADTLAKCDAAASVSSQCVGIASAAISANGTGIIIKRGVAQGVLTQATPGAPIYLAVGGGLTATLTTAFGSQIVRMGYAKNATDLDVNPVYLGQRAAS